MTKKKKESTPSDYSESQIQQHHGRKVTIIAYIDQCIVRNISEDLLDYEI